MDDTPFYRRAWFYIAAWLAILLVVYGWQISRMGGIIASELDIIIDLVCIFPVLLLVWMAFFAQFVLPVRTFADRQKIFNRLLSHLFGGHGPAIFIRNGELIKREGEERQKGAGVLWLDTASGAVTRSAVAIKQVLGPGVHFIERGEFIAGTVDLHVQSQSVGPKERDKPFEEKKEDQTTEEYHQIQDRRKQVSALTRDGIEIIPNISVSFRVDTGIPEEKQPGSRFGYRTGHTKKEKQNEKKDQEAILKAIMGEGINPNAQTDSPRHRVAWNQLPALLAIDVWREYAAKFTLDELFTPTQVVPLPPVPLAVPTEEELDPLSQPIQVSANREAMQDSLTRMLREINIFMDKTIQWLEGKKEDQRKKPAVSAVSVSTTTDKSEAQMKTGLQVINDMVKARLTQPSVDKLDDTGRRVEGDIKSREYRLLQERGLVVKSVGISNLRFSPLVEEQLFKQWSATWMSHARMEREQIDRRRSLVEATSQERAIVQYAEALSREIINKNPAGFKDTLKTLLMHSQLIIISSDQLRRRMSSEQQDLEGILKWVEANGP